MKSMIARMVEFSRRHAPAVVLVALLGALLGGMLVARRIGIDSDTGKLVDPNLPWQARDHFHPWFRRRADGSLLHLEVHVPYAKTQRVFQPKR